MKLIDAFTGQPFDVKVAIERQRALFPELLASISTHHSLNFNFRNKEAAAEILKRSVPQDFLLGMQS